MKRWIGIVCMLLLPMMLWAALHSYVDHSVLREGRFVKISVSETGVYCLPYDSLQAWGLDPSRVRILGYGGNMLSENFTLPKHDDLPSIPYYMHKGSNGVFDKGDYLLFYAEGPVTWKYAGGRWRHIQHPYSQFGYYFLSDDAGEQLLISEAVALDGSNANDVDWYVRYMVHEIDSVNLVDKSGVSGGGREFYCDKLHGRSNGLHVQFDVPDALLNHNLLCMTDLAVISSKASRVTVGIGADRVVKNIAAVPNDSYSRAVRDSISLTAKVNDPNKMTVKIDLSSTAIGVEGYLNYVEVNVPCSLVMRGNQMPICNVKYLSTSSPTRFTLRNTTADTQIWRVTDGVHVEQMSTDWSNGLLSWVGSNEKAEKYVALNVNGTGWKIPRMVGKVKNQDLHALNNIDYVIICPSEFVEQAIRLAKKHEEKDFLTWAVVTDEEVYNEFSSGTPDVTAYRWLMKMLYDRANGDESKQPKSLLLMGNASYDNRNILGSTSGVSRLLVYEANNSVNEMMAYATDDYCGFLLDNAGMQSNGWFSESYATMQIGVGRLPVRTLEQATQVVDKLCHYMDNPYLGKWKNQVCFLADDGDHGLHVETAEAGAIKIAAENPSFALTKIYLDAHTQEVNASGESYPLAKEQFRNMIDKGVLFMNYSGHGGYNNITSELILRTRDIKNLRNQHLAFWFLATCSFSHYDGGIPSAGEELLLNPNGGAIGVVSACRTVFVSQNTDLNRHFCDTILGHKGVADYQMTIGEATRAAKNAMGIDMNKLAYVLLGDPALRLNYPTDYSIQTTSSLDTLRALTEHTIAGYVMTSEGDTASWFNGTMDVTIWDKKQRSLTRDNDEPDEAKKKKKAFDDYPNTLFSGQTDVVDGKFEFAFMVPKDIRYNYGKGRMVFYAYDEQTGEEANGHFENFVIGGSSTVEIVDTIGPDIQLYLNTPAFVDGGETYEFPHFYAEVYDEHGINTVGSGIGHDLLMVLDNDPKQAYVLNDYFVTHSNSYQSGLVSYKMPEMTEGAHTLTFRAWDLLNNSNMATLNFHVVKGLAPTIYQVTTYPNPVSSMGVLHIRIAFDQVDELTETCVSLYDLNGRLIKTYAQTSADEIRWDMSEIGLSSGIYMYQVRIKTTTSDYVSRAGKIIICK